MRRFSYDVYTKNLFPIEDICILVGDSICDFCSSSFFVLRFFVSFVLSNSRLATYSHTAGSLENIFRPFRCGGEIV